MDINLLIDEKILNLFAEEREMAVLQLLSQSEELKH